MHLRGMQRGVAALVTLSLLAASLRAAAAAGEDLPWKRPPRCNPATCSGCAEFRVSTDNFTDSSGMGANPTDPCGTDGVYFPVPTEFFANCAEWYPYAWRCIPCCSAACGGGGACKAGGEGKYDTTHGCSACPAGAAPRTLDLPASTCRSCFRSRTCFEEQPTAYRVCELRAPGQAITQPAPAPANPPAAEPALSPPPPPAAEEAPRAALPPPRAIIDEQAAPAQVPAPAPVAQQTGDEVLQGGAPQPAPSTDELLEPAPAPAPAPASTQGSAVVAAAAAPAPSSGAALAAPAAPLLALLLCAAVLGMLL